MTEPLRIAHRVPCTRAEGPGARFALWLAGCTLRCPGCCNPELFEPDSGERVEVKALAREIELAQLRLGVEGITVLGGEPLEQSTALGSLCGWAGARGLGVIVFTGYTRVEAERRPGFARLWASIDTLVDGRFDARRPEPTSEAGGRRWIGSANQQLHHRSSRYADPGLWRGPNHVEVRIGPNGEVSAHGFPPLLRRVVRRLAT